MKMLGLLALAAAGLHCATGAKRCTMSARIAERISSAAGNFTQCVVRNSVPGNVSLCSRCDAQHVAYKKAYEDDLPDECKILAFSAVNIGLDSTAGIWTLAKCDACSRHELASTRALASTVWDCLNRTSRESNHTSPCEACTPRMDNYTRALRDLPKDCRNNAEVDDTYRVTVRNWSGAECKKAAMDVGPVAAILSVVYALVIAFYVGAFMTGSSSAKAEDAEEPSAIN